MTNTFDQRGLNSLARADLMRIFAAAVAAVEPRRVISAAFQGDLPGTPDLREILKKANRVRLLAVGKAAMGMAIEGREQLGPKLGDALVIVSAGNNPTGLDHSHDSRYLRVLPAAHPIANESSETAGRAALEFVGN